MTEKEIRDKLEDAGASIFLSSASPCPYSDQVIYGDPLNAVHKAIDFLNFGNPYWEFLSLYEIFNTGEKL